MPQPVVGTGHYYPPSMGGHSGQPQNLGTRSVSQNSGHYAQYTTEDQSKPSTMKQYTAIPHSNGTTDQQSFDRKP